MAFQTGGCIWLHESSAESSKNMSFIWSLNTGLTVYAFCFRPIFTAKLAISGIYLARSLGSNKKHMKHEVYDQALKILTEQSISEINELKDPGMESVKYVQTFLAAL